MRRIAPPLPAASQPSNTRIVEAFYEQAEDKRAAAQEIMAVTDYPAFLAGSGYAGKVKQRSTPGNP